MVILKNYCHKTWKLGAKCAQFDRLWLTDGILGQPMVVMWQATLPNQEEKKASYERTNG